jgi:hypothetical protein
MTLISIRAGKMMQPQTQVSERWLTVGDISAVIGSVLMLNEENTTEQMVLDTLCGGV